MRRQMIALFVAALLLCGMSFPVFAHDVPEEGRTGTIEVTMGSGEDAVPGGTLTIYRVGDIVEDDGNYSFRLNELFAQSGLALTDVQSRELAEGLADYAAANSYGGVTQEIDENGHVVFAVEQGLYLLVQQEAAEGYCTINPFLISVPNMKNGVYVYEVDASPKVDLIPAPTEPEGTNPTTPPDETLPQTGQLNWPVPLLAVAGVVLFAIGWAMRRKENYET